MIWGSFLSEALSSSWSKLGGIGAGDWDTAEDDLKKAVIFDCIALSSSCKIDSQPSIKIIIPE